MRFTSFFSLAAAGLLFGVASASDPAWDVPPTCAVNCTISVLLGSGTATTCSPTNTACLCVDESYQVSVATCVASTCTVKESLVAKRLGQRQCGVPPRRQQNDVAALTVLFAITFVLVMVRLTVKFLGQGGGWVIDDWLMLMAFSFSITLYGVHLWRIYGLGLGKDTWEVPFDNITKILTAFWANEMLYVVHISVAKVSVCFFYLRIFDASPVFRHITYPVIGLNIFIAVFFVFLIIFQCGNKVHLAWTGWAAEEPGRCLDIYKLVLGNGIINLVMDFVIIGLPIYETTKLQLSRTKKLVCIVRCVTFWRTRSIANPTINLMPLAIWSCIETLVAIMCACLPDSRFFFSRLVPNFYKTLSSSIHYKSSGRESSVGHSWRTLENVISSQGSSQKPMQSPKKASRKREEDEEEMTASLSLR
ncbi:CFEM domain-containing protein [Diaporthe helianthi]|uniref:CFEM domain-containing protein n=1 Tax=Diaporthe helianthi TaxID=158607 RepID=A0A2P5HQS6_DIAHE|nr:CFEM domain-containing protein [Diaporthe helianthi]